MERLCRINCTAREIEMVLKEWRTIPRNGKWLGKYKKTRRRNKRINHRIWFSSLVYLWLNCDLWRWWCWWRCGGWGGFVSICFPIVNHSKFDLHSPVFVGGARANKWKAMYERWRCRGTISSIYKNGSVDGCESQTRRKPIACNKIDE